MSKDIAVAQAINNQLLTDGNPPEATNNMGADYHYDDNGIVLFLRAVHNRLRNGAPSYSFVYEESFPSKALAMTVAALTGEAALRTS